MHVINSDDKYKQRRTEAVQTHTVAVKRTMDMKERFVRACERAGVHHPSQSRAHFLVNYLFSGWQLEVHFDTVTLFPYCLITIVNRSLLTHRLTVSFFKFYAENVASE